MLIYVNGPGQEAGMVTTPELLPKITYNGEMTFLDDLPRPFFILAPMDDVTDTVFRQIVADCQAPDVYFTEFVNVDGLQSPGRHKLLPKLQFTDKEKPLVAQLWGKKPDNFYQTAKEVKAMGFAGVDLNMGCPAKPVVKNGCCSALINNRELAGEMIAAVREAVGPDFPVSVKTRVGFTTVDLSWTEFLLQQKLNMLTIHGRTVRELSKVPAHWDLIGEVAQQRASLSPETVLIGNGDVMNRAQGEQLARQYGLDGIMIGRGVFDDPYVFARQSPWPEQTSSQRIELYAKHVKLFAATWQKQERRVVTLNKFCKVYIQGFPGAKELREKLMDAQTTDELLGLLQTQER
jgi:tRNA-dihydrouridine synthase